MKIIIKILGLKFNATQYAWGRKMYGGSWYLIYPAGLQMGAFWSDKEIKSCQSYTVEKEIW